MCIYLYYHRGGGTHEGVDVACSAGSNVYAPISGTYGIAIPYGDGSCCDNGFDIAGSGAWSGMSNCTHYL